jgi:O-methyltransferase
MKKVAIFGTGALGNSLRYRLEKVASVIMIDNNPAKWNDEVHPPEKLKNLDLDHIYIAVSFAIDDIYAQLTEKLNIPAHKIITFWAANADDAANFEMRIKWIEPFSTYINIHGITGSIAEAGVLAGNYSRHINRLFPDRRLYLFDTFEGYTPRDFEAERGKNEMFDEFQKGSNLPETSVELVLSKLPYPDMAVIKKGYFPETFDITDDKFCFVFLDLNLYNPTKAGLEIFYPLMSRGGVILIHDYFYGTQNGVSRAVDEFLKEQSLLAIPAGDSTAIAIIKN